jgi:phosphatidate cytidylyltransferase
MAAETSASLLVVIAMAVAVFAYERGEDQSINTFAFNMTGMFYIGWLGSYLIALRDLPSGLWWILLTLPTAWAGDVGAYLVGSAMGRHRFAPRVSPRKSWEGYFGGVVASLIWCVAIAFAVQTRAPEITPLKGIFLGAVVGLTAPMGDLFESLIKRQFGVKDSSNLLPGHGGFLDRIDSSLWTGVVSYFIIVIFLLN